MFPISTRIAGTVVACALAAPASAQLLTVKSIPIGMAVTMAQTAMETCKANGYAVSVSVVGRNGEPPLPLRGHGTGAHTMATSYGKPYPAHTFRIPPAGRANGGE